MGHPSSIDTFNDLPTTVKGANYCGKIKNGKRNKVEKKREKKEKKVESRIFSWGLILE